VVRRLVECAAVLALAALALSACGDGETDVSSTESPRNTATVTVTEVAALDEGATLAEGASVPTKGFDELQQWDSPPALALEEGVDYQARIQTNHGEIMVDLFEEEAPVTVNNFVFLAEQGFYENVPIHRVLSGFVIQSGDPTGTGRGNPGYSFNDEPISRDYVKGTLAMANSGANTNGSQFFITLDDLSGRLPKQYTIFGEVVEGMTVVDEIADVPVTTGASGEPSSPTEPVFISNVEIVKS
jgi:cyclophilin family peptidyl-prolyl cis-trans isomerase